MALKRAVVKAQVLTHYGNGRCQCVKCGFSDLRALSIDHIHNDGKKHRDRVGAGGTQMYRWLIKNNYPEGYQTLCMNCQFIRRFQEKKKDYDFIGQPLPSKVKTWIELWDAGRFWIRDIRLGLGLQGKDSQNVRHILFRMCRSGKLIRVSPGCYKKKVKSVSVSDFLMYQGKILNKD